MAEPEGKAAGFITVSELLREAASPDDWRDYLAALPPDIAKLVEHPPFPSAWLPSRVFFTMLDIAGQKLMRNDPQRAFELGRQQMRRDLTGIYRIFIRIASPQYVIERAAKIWGTYTRNAGEFRVVEKGDRNTTAECAGIPFPSPFYWSYLRGCVHGSLELTGVKGLDVSIVEGGDYQPRALFRTRWS